MTKISENKKQLPASLFLMLLQFVQKEYELDTSEFLSSRHINPQNLDASSLVPLDYISELIEWVMKIKQDYEVLFDISKLSSPSRLGLLGYLMIHSKNVFEALSKFCQYYLLVGNRIRPVLSRTPHGYKMVIYFSDESGELMDFTQYSVAIHVFAVIHLINHIIPKNIKPSHITFKQPRFDALYHNEVAGIKTSFSQEEDALFFTQSCMEIPTVSFDPRLLKMFEKEAEETLQLKLDASALKERIRGLILVSSSSLDISLESIASKAGMHPRVLQKELKKEGSSFSVILSEVRQKLCVYYLSKEMDLQSIAISLGYLDLSSFFRAFKKWYDMTPSQWKINHN